MYYIMGVYKRRVQAEIESYKGCEDIENIDPISSQDIIMLDRISI